MTAACSSASRRRGWSSSEPWLYSRANGCAEEEDEQVQARQAARDAPARGPAPEPLPAVRPAEAAAPDVSELQDVRRPRDRALADADAMNPGVSTVHFRRTPTQSLHALMTASQAMP